VYALMGYMKQQHDRISGKAKGPCWCPTMSQSSRTSTIFANGGYYLLNPSTNSVNYQSERHKFHRGDRDNSESLPSVTLGIEERKAVWHLKCSQRMMNF